MAGFQVSTYGRFWLSTEGAAGVEPDRSSLLFGSTVSESGTPVSWPTVKMHDGHDVDVVRLNAIQETVGKLRKQNTPEQTAEGCAGGRVREQSFIRPLNREGEVEPQPFRSVLVKLRRRNELVLCFWMKLNASHRSAERTFFITFSAGIAVTFPDLSSISRRSASASQSLSVSASTP